VYLEPLSNAVGVSGAEEEVRQIIRDALGDHVDEMREDALGNLLVLKRGTGPEPRPRVMLAAHMDEVGMMVVGYTGDGGLKFRAVGGLDARVLAGAQVQVGPDHIPGIIGLKPIHLLERDERERIPKIENLVIEIGASSKDEAKKAVRLGERATFLTRYQELGPTVTGKAFDDRAGCAVLIELLQGEPLPFDLYGAFTVQEEVGLRGARVAAYAIEPDAAFVLEGTIADDLPRKEDVSPTTALGKGPAITVMDRSFIADKRLLRLLFDTAEALGIPTQIKQPGIGGTDAGAIHITREGIPSAAVSVPCRYIHSPVAMLNLTDFQQTVRLMRAALERWTP